MIGRDTQFAETSEMGIDLGYKGYKGTLLDFDIVLDTSKANIRQKNSRTSRRMTEKGFNRFH